LVRLLLRNVAVNDHGRLTAVVALPDQSGRVDVLASLTCQGEIVTRAAVALRGEYDIVGSLAALRRNQPRAIFESDFAAGRDFQAPEFPHVHSAIPSLVRGGRARMAEVGAFGANPPRHLALGVVGTNSKGFLFLRWTNYTHEIDVSKW